MKKFTIYTRLVIVFLLLQFFIVLSFREIGDLVIWSTIIWIICYMLIKDIKTSLIGDKK